MTEEMLPAYEFWGIVSTWATHSKIFMFLPYYSVFNCRQNRSHISICRFLLNIYSICLTEWYICMELHLGTWCNEDRCLFQYNMGKIHYGIKTWNVEGTGTTTSWCYIVDAGLSGYYQVHKNVYSIHLLRKCAGIC